MPSPDSDNTVMIVDDSPFMRKMLRSLLELHGFRVVAEAENGMEAVGFYSEFRPYVTFMDIMMPVKSGVDATSEILSINPKAKIVLCSSLGHEDTIKSALDSGARDVVFKPYTVEQLKQVFKRLDQF